MKSNGTHIETTSNILITELNDEIDEEEMNGDVVPNKFER